MNLASNFGQIISSILDVESKYTIEIRKIISIPSIPSIISKDIPKLDKYTKTQYSEDILDGVHRKTNLCTSKSIVYEERCFIVDDWIMIIQKHLSPEYIPQIIDYDRSFEYTEYTHESNIITFYNNAKTIEKRYTIDPKSYASDLKNIIKDESPR